MSDQDTNSGSKKKGGLFRCCGGKKNKNDQGSEDLRRHGSATPEYSTLTAERKNNSKPLFFGRMSTTWFSNKRQLSKQLTGTTDSFGENLFTQATILSLLADYVDPVSGQLSDMELGKRGLLERKKDVERYTICDFLHRRDLDFIFPFA